MYKLLFLLFVLMILFLVQDKCEKEGFFSLIYKPKECNDDPEWFVENKEGKHYCGNIGKSVSCYDRDAVGREGWEQCLKSCGNCVDTKVSKAPMGVLAGFSGDPYEDFGVVLHMSEDRQWVGKTASEGGGGDDIRGYVMGEEQGEDISNLTDRMDSVEDIFDMITGNVKTCSSDAGKGCGGDKKGFKGCDDGACLSCPNAKSKSKDNSRTYIKQTSDGSIQFPGVEISCKKIPDDAKKGGSCKDYFLFDKIIDKDEDKPKDQDTDKDKRISLLDMCPTECGVQSCKKKT